MIKLESVELIECSKGSHEIRLNFEKSRHVTAVLKEGIGFIDVAFVLRAFSSRVVRDRVLAKSLNKQGD